MRKTRPLRERYFEKLSMPSPTACWEWRAARTRGYGSFSSRRAHRVAWELWIGPIPPGLCVCHHCDNPPCCNPSHLFLGTQQDNLMDARRKGRMAVAQPMLPLGSPKPRRVWLGIPVRSRVRSYGDFCAYLDWLDG